jgi:hypothetical protein
MFSIADRLLFQEGSLGADLEDFVKMDGDSSPGAAAVQFKYNPDEHYTVQFRGSNGRWSPADPDATAEALYRRIPGA